MSTDRGQGLGPVFPIPYVIIRFIRDIRVPFRLHDAAGRR